MTHSFLSDESLIKSFYDNDESSTVIVLIDNTEQI